MLRPYMIICGLSLGIASPTIASSSSNRELELINHVQKCIASAEQKASKLTAEVMAVEGMTSPRVKCLLNNLCSLPNASYLEIGVWKGATFTAAVFGNKSLFEAIAIDDWSDCGGPKDEFHQNCKLLSAHPYKFYCHNAFTITNKKEIFSKPIDIYFYDGDHTAEAQEKAFTCFDTELAPVFIAVIDDWNHQPAREGTFRAFDKLGYEILYSRELPAAFNGDVSQWWNGIYIAVIRHRD